MMSSYAHWPGGDGGIRTHETTCTVTSLAGKRLQPDSATSPEAPSVSARRLGAVHEGRVVVIGAPKGSGRQVGEQRARPVAVCFLPQHISTSYQQKS